MPNVTDTDYELQANKQGKFFYIVQEIQSFLVSLQPNGQLKWGFNQNIAF